MYPPTVPHFAVVSHGLYALWQMSAKVTRLRIKQSFLWIFEVFSADNVLCNVISWKELIELQPFLRVLTEMKVRTNWTLLVYMFICFLLHILIKATTSRGDIKLVHILSRDIVSIPCQDTILSEIHLKLKEHISDVLLSEISCPKQITFLSLLASLF